MEIRNTTEILTLDGNSLLARFQANGRNARPVCLDVDMIKSICEYRESALLYQVRQVLQQDFSRDIFKKNLFFVDFWEFFQYNDRGRSALFKELLEKGFCARWADSQETVYYVPFEKSQSQAKNCVISFIRQELFLPVRKRLDLEIGFGDYAGGDAPEGFPLRSGVTQLSKLYAYRGLYLTEALRLDGVEELLDPARIVILEEFPIRISGDAVATCTAERTGTSADGKQAVLSEVWENNAGASYEFDPFDGVGLISPRGAALLNRAMDRARFAASGIDPEDTDPQALREKGMAVSFQFRLPFCKGMLHTVDFHRFLREEGELPGDCWVEDAFGVQRNLKDADIILNQTLFKLLGLLKHETKAAPERKPQLIRHYFEKIKEYGHSIYIVKTDREQRRTGYARLTAQIINTLPFTQEAFDRLVLRHTRRAEQYRLPAVLLSEGKLPVLEEDSGETVRKYLKTNYCLALDAHVESLMESCRKQALHDLYLGKIEVEGDMRFLSRDLMYCLYRLAKRCGSGKKLSLIPQGTVYLPGEGDGRPCAVFRSPHLCPNENVSAVTALETDLYRRYLGHLSRVAFVGSFSRMPDALGGADFDGDMVVIAFQPEVVEACQKNCYREDGTGLPLIRIPSLKPERSTDAVTGDYVDVRTIENTFNSRIGLITNATMKICAAEAASGAQLPCSSRFCAILNGVEIDAAKTGVRPDLTEVVTFSNTPGVQVSREAAQAMELVGTYLRLRKELRGSDLAGISIGEDKDRYTVRWGAQELAGFLKDGAGKPFVYQLLCRWAQALLSGTRETDEKDQAVEKLRAMLRQAAPVDKQPVFSEKQRQLPRDEVLKRLVFRIPDSFTRQQIQGAKAVLRAYGEAKQALDDLRETMDPAQQRIARKNLIYLLRYQYDDVDDPGADQLTVRQLGNGIDAQLGLSMTSSREVGHILEHAFYCTGETADPWLFRTEQARQAWLRTLLDPATAQIAGDFSTHGYDLMYYALRERYHRALAGELRGSLSGNTGDAFKDSLLEAAGNALEKGYSTSQITKRLLPPICRRKLEELTAQTDLNVLIPLVYGCAKTAEKPVFWQLFFWEEIEKYLKEAHGDVG